MKTQKRSTKLGHELKKKKNQNKLSTSIICVFSIIVSFFLDKIVINVMNVIQYPLLFNFFYTITLLGEVYVFVWIALLLIIALMINRRPLFAFILSVVTTGILEWLIKTIIQRPRPFEAMHINNMVTTSMSSFPSGHTMIFFSIIPIISKNFPKTRIILWTLAILVGISRLYLGVHYLSDVVAGAIFGYFIGWTFMKIGEKYAWKS